jgi:hypothetical protein
MKWAYDFLGVMVTFYTLTYNFFIHEVSFDKDSKIPWYLIPGLAMSKIYSNSMLALLNSRVTITGGRSKSISSLEPSGGMLTTAVWQSGGEDQSVGDFTRSSDPQNL